MTTLAQFIGSDGPVTSIVNRFSDSGAAQATGLATAAATVGKAVASGAVTSGVLKTGLSVTGRGRLNFFAITSADVTARTHRVRITADGVVVFDSTSASTGSSGAGIVPVGWFSGSTCGPQPINFFASLLVEFTSSVTETDKQNLYYSYEVWQ